MFQQSLFGHRHNERWIKISPTRIKQAYGRGKLQIHTFVPLTLDRGKWSAISTNNFTVENSLLRFSFSLQSLMIDLKGTTANSTSHFE